jgi:PAS domain S-box-containing protein
MARRKLTPEEKLLYELETVRKQLDGGSEARTIVQEEDEQVTFLLESDIEPVEDGQAEPAQAGAGRYRALVEAIPDGFALLALMPGPRGQVADLRIVEVNRAFEVMTGLAADRLVGRTVLEVLPDTEPSWIAACAGVAATGDPVRIESRSRTLNMPLEVVAFRLDGRVACTFQDITDRVEGGGDAGARAQAELRSLIADLLGRLEADRAEVVAMLHERLRQELAGLGMKLGMSQACADQGDTARITGIIDEAIRQIGAMGETVGGALRKLRPRKLADEGLFGALAWHADRLSKDTPMLVLVEGAPPSPRLPADRELALFRLVEEALLGVAAPAGATRALVTLEPRAAGLTLTLSHNGVNEPPALGLVAARERAFALGASFHLEPTPGGGARMVVRL